MKTKLFIFVLVVLSFYTIHAGNLKENTTLPKPTTIGLIERMDINNIDLPIQNNGSTGDDAKAYYPNGQTTLSFLFQGGFATSGYVNGQLRASWMAPASLVEEWQPGIWGMNPTDPLARFYVVNKSDVQGSQAYIDWADAVSIGAEFEDLNGDGLYDPYIDRPDMIGTDRIIWFPINDNTSSAQRTPRLNTAPLGLEVHMQVFAFARADELGDVIFFRYRLINPTQNNIDDMIFSVWEDPDIGNSDDDLIGCDTTLSLGYIYNDADDPNYGINPPAHGVDYFQGPVVESVGDTAYLYRGPFFGIDTLPDMRNLPMTSFMFYMNGHPIINDPNTVEIARNYQLGGIDQQGNPLDPSAWGTGGLATDDPTYIYPGDPVAQTGWYDNTPDDKRLLVNCGPFQLASGDTQDIVAAYVVAQGGDALESVTRLKSTDVIAQAAYDANFFVAGPPPEPKVDARVFDNRIELIIDLEANRTAAYDLTDPLGNRMIFEALEVYQFFSDNPGNTVRSIENAKIIKRYDLNNQYGAIYSNQPDGTIDKVWDGYDNIDPAAFADSGSAIIKLTITTDAFNNNEPLVNGTEYYFAVTAFALNHNRVNAYPAGGADAWIINGNANFLSTNRTAAYLRITPGSSEFKPFKGDIASYTGSRHFHDGNVYFDVVNHDSLKNHEYTVSFSDNGTLWYLFDETMGTMLLDRMTFQADSPDEWNFPIVDGISARVVNVPDKLDTALVTSGVSWIVGNPGTSFDTISTFNDGINFVKFEKPNLSTFTNDRYFPVLLDFDTTMTGKAYRYRANYNLFSGSNDVRVRAFDISDPNNPRQVNIVYLSNVVDLNFTAHEVLIMSSDYQADNAYSAAPDSAFRADAYLIMDLRPANANADTIWSSEFELTVYPNYPNSDLDEYTFSTEEVMASLTSSDRKDLLERVKVVPNPFWGYSFGRYDTSYDNPILKFIHLDKTATIRIFNLAGQLVKTIEKNSDANEVTWNLRNEANLKVASGMYIAHIEVPGIGSKIVKFALIQREERIDRY